MQKGSGNGALLMRKRIVFVIINRKKYDDINILVINKISYRNQFKVRFKGQVMCHIIGRMEAIPYNFDKLLEVMEMDE